MLLRITYIFKGIQQNIIAFLRKWKVMVLTGRYDGPDLSGSLVKVVDARQVGVLRVPREAAAPGPVVHHGRGDSHQPLLHESLVGVRTRRVSLQLQESVQVVDV